MKKIIKQKKSKCTKVTFQIPEERLTVTINIPDGKTQQEVVDEFLSRKHYFEHLKTNKQFHVPSNKVKIKKPYLTPVK